MSHRPQQHALAAYAAVAAAMSAKPTSSFFMFASSFNQASRLYTCVGQCAADHTPLAAFSISAATTSGLDT